MDNPDSGSEDAVTETLEQEKLRLEVKQLRNSSRIFDGRVRAADLLHPLVTLVIAICTIVLASKTGLLDAKRLELSATSERFRTENMLAEARQREMQLQYDALSERVDSLGSIVKNTEKIRQVVKRLSDDPALDIDLNFLAEPPELSINVFVGELAGSPNYEFDLDGVFGALHSIERLVTFDRIEISYVTLSKSDVAAIVSLDPRQLKLIGNMLGNEEASRLSELRAIKSMSLKNQAMDDLSWLSTVPKLESLEIVDVPIDGNDFERNFDFAESLRSLVLNDVSVGDEVVQVISRFPRLRLLAIKDTNVSVEGLRKLAARVELSLIAKTDASERQLGELRSIRGKGGRVLHIGNFDSGLDFETHVKVYANTQNAIDKFATDRPE